MAEPKQILIRHRTSQARWVLGLVLLSFAAGACARDRGIEGQEYRLTKEKHGNIAWHRAKTVEQRAKIFTDVLRDRAREFSGKKIAKKDLEFQTVGESRIVLPNGQTHILIVVYQTYHGARIIDQMQYGSFNARTGQLRTIRANLQPVKGLPEPPKPDPNVWSQLHDQFRAYVKARFAYVPNFAISDQPVISAKLHVAGYLVQFSHRNDNGTLTRFAGVIDPGNGQVSVLRDVTSD